MRSKVIVVEGPDGSGKSTLASQLGKHYGWPVIHDGGPINSREEFLVRVEEKGYFLNTSIIYDRCCYISELIYGQEPYSTRKELDFFLEKVQPVLVFCSLDASKEMVANMLLTKPNKTQEWIDQIKLNHPEITRKYWQLFNSLTNFRYNWKYASMIGLTTRIDSCVG